MSSMESSNLTIETLKRMFEKEKRFDGRNLLEHRKIDLEFNVSNKAEGSARIRIGKTEVIAGVKLQVGEPYPDSPDKGNLMVSGDLLPLASPRFEMGPPDFYAIELPRLVDRAIRECGMIDMEKLVITPKEKVWTIIIDIYPINDDGNLIDAATFAAVAALKSTTFPELNEEGKIDYDKKTNKKLPLSKETSPIPLTFYKLGNSLVLDPTREEAESCEVRISFGISIWNKQLMINSCQKSGAVPFSQEEIENMMQIIPKKFDELNEKLKKFF
ncbi:exosome complex protein Rrp42 [Candidatus Pacearchaeota archaeon]|nr:exosome complex protein Rrp42 [Candidatus Pacearchaeota archaeon]